ncbi:polysaccharide deacetylase family protein [Eubacterium sp. MSJ-13]|uniref:polysaccharide deacetylase family protein n=1 Tax=Eubacterium sp. MSJ-13 TaxID=2841513 RepID=UPI001C102EF2|nr:polysaccharide deacetylase family protein [Eubacterium sp. MSJ-13]MBU5478212.1 polysaccharide deacetylase family protein [Eubacterium sp. MSJ-13]
MKRNDEMRIESYRDREMRSRRRRERELRKTKMILINAAIALVVILVVFVIAIIKLNGKNNSNIKNYTNKNVSEKSKTRDSSKSKTKKDSSKQKKPAATSTAVPADSNSMGDGTKKWIRTDLDKDKPMIALSFDDGPYTPVTGKILKVLKKYDSRATFFVVGNRVNTYSKVLKESYDMGNQIASHTFDHEDLSKMTKKQLSAEMTKTNKALQSVIGCHASLIRPPYGNISDLMRKNIKIPMIYWSIDTDDWKWRNAAKVLAECKNVQDGDIILMHDLYSSTADAVKKLVPRLKKKGYQLVTIDEMFYYKGIKAEAGKVYASGRQ